MNISEDTLKALNELYKYNLYDDQINYASTENATIISICWERGGDGRDGFFSKFIRAKKGEITLNWILGKINQ